MREGAQYLVYAIKRFGWSDGLRRWFMGYGSPHLIPSRIRNRYQSWRLVDRRKKRSSPFRVYAVDRDGDLYLIECPQCHRTQSVSMHDWRSDQPCNRCGKQGETHFHCYHELTGFDVYLEDGLREILDHRIDNPPNPIKVVKDDQGKYRMGISDDAPWWWRRLSVYYDYNPENGKDAHGHQPYTVWPIDPAWTKERMMQESPECCEDKGKR